MMTLLRSTVRIRSRITRYWLSGVSSELRNFAHSSSQAFLAAATSSLSEANALPPPPGPFCRDDLGDQRVEHQRRVADHSVIGAVLLVDVARVVGRMDDGLAGRHARPERRLGEARADREHQIGLGHELGVHLRPRAGRGAERQRMAFGDRALARIGGDDRRGQKLGQRREPLAGLGVVHALAGPGSAGSWPRAASARPSSPRPDRARCAAPAPACSRARP